MVKETGVEVEWKAFELRPEGIELPPKPAAYMEQVKAGIEALSKQYGLDMQMNTKSKHSRLALEGAKFAKKHSKENEYHDAVFSAQFQKNLDINNMDVLVKIADDMGLDAHALRNILENRTYEKDVVHDVEEANDLGITGIPCFISGNQGAMGVQSYESLLNLIGNE